MIIDILLILFIIGGFWLGYTRGIAGTLMVVAGYILVVLITLEITPWLVRFLIRNLHLEPIFALIFGTLAVLILLIFLVHKLAVRISQYFTKSKPPAVSKIFGGLVLVLVFAAFYSLVVFTLNHFHMVGEKARQTSMSYPTLIAIPTGAKTVAAKTKPIFDDFGKLMEETTHEQHKVLPDSTKAQ